MSNVQKLHATPKKMAHPHTTHMDGEERRQRKVNEEEEVEIEAEAKEEVEKE